MKKVPNTALAAVFAANIGSIGCAGQQIETNTPQPQEASVECDRKDMQDIKVISSEPGRTVYKICHTTYVAETRNAADSTMKQGDVPTKPDVEVKVCDTRDLRNWRTVSRTPTKTVIQICDMIQTAEIHRPSVSATISRPSVSATRTTPKVSAEKKEPKITGEKKEKE